MTNSVNFVEEYTVMIETKKWIGKLRIAPSD